MTSSRGPAELTICSLKDSNENKKMVGRKGRKRKRRMRRKGGEERKGKEWKRRKKKDGGKEGEELVSLFCGLIVG